MVLAMTDVGPAIPALMRPKDQKNFLKVVVLSDLKLYQAAFLAFYTNFSRVSDVVYHKLQSEFQKNAPKVHIITFFEDPDSRT